MLVVVDYGLGNLGSVLNMLRKVGAEAQISSEPERIARASGLILPGVGHFDHGMRNLRSRGLVAPLNEAVLVRHTPILGICLGMQLFARGSEEGTEPGLGWIPADVRKIDVGHRNLRIPHMGWNDTCALDPRLFAGLEQGARFYYVHSYHVVCDDPNDVAARCTYGQEVTAAIRRGNIFGTQFHPEKSHKFGMRLLRNFVEIVADAPAGEGRGERCSANA